MPIRKAGRRSSARCPRTCRGWSASAASTSTPRACCCSPTTAGWRGCWNCRRPAGCGAIACGALGRVTQEALDRLRGGVTLDGIRYGAIEATLDREQGSNVWLTFAIREGKNREVRKVLESLGLKVNRLIRVAYGPFELGDLDDGAVKEVETEELRTQLGPALAEQAQADFDAARFLSLPATRAVQSFSRAGVGAMQRATKEPHPAAARASQRGGRRKHRRDRSGGPRPSRPRPK